MAKIYRTPDVLHAITRNDYYIDAEGNYTSERNDAPLEVHTKEYELLKEIDKMIAEVFFASPFWTKLQNIFGHCCKSILDKVAKHWLALNRPAV